MHRPRRKIIGVRDKRKLSVRAAEKLTGVGAAEFSRLRNVRLDSFTLDRMITILGKLDRTIEVSVRARPRRPPGPPLVAAQAGTRIRRA